MTVHRAPRPGVHEVPLLFPRTRERMHNAVALVWAVSGLLHSARGRR